MTGSRTSHSPACSSGAASHKGGENTLFDSAVKTRMNGAVNLFVDYVDDLHLSFALLRKALALEYPLVQALYGLIIQIV